ncbi:MULTISPECIES: hypothetical protein [Aeromonas]|uniref:hypothetical protein n=1 Tax=Aeromonas TaxID=642 RepID=UPI000B1ECA02|nr:hypothetical protein [Aeromonas veronii]MCD6617490.1 hypothetical protein [Aeromonas veronii]NJI21262.1 hypothetical protein [Aeromonas veronii]
MTLLAASRQTSKDVTDKEAEKKPELDNHVAQVFKPAGLPAHQRTRLSNMMRLKVIAFI